MILDGKSVAEGIKQGVKARVARLPIIPCLACIVVEGDGASEIYVSSKVRACEECGITSQVVKLPAKTTQSQLERTIAKLNRDNNVNAILLQLPLPKHLDATAAIEKIKPSKDVDCLTALNLGRLFAGQSRFAPCTANGIIKLLDANSLQIEGKQVVVIGRSLLVGRSVATLLEKRNATVTLCHSKTQDLAKVASQADILIVAIGKARFITADYVKEGAIVVDVGINRLNGKIYGDVDYESVKDKCAFITPVPGGVGPLTVASLMENTVALAEKQEM